MIGRPFGVTVAPLRSRSASASPSVCGPVRPRNMSTISAICPAPGSLGGDPGREADRAESGGRLEERLR